MSFGEFLLTCGVVIGAVCLFVGIGQSVQKQVERDNHILYTVIDADNRVYWHVDHLHNYSTYCEFTTPEGQKIQISGNRTVMQESP